MKLRELNLATSIGTYDIDVHFNRLEETIRDFEENEGLQIIPDFQRGHVWSEEQQIAFIRFLLNNPRRRQRLYFNCSEWGTKDMVLVDGLQRLTAIRLFMSDKLKIDGRVFTEFEDHKIFGGRYSIKFNVNNLKTRNEILTWYIEMNTGGTPHTKKEIQKVVDLIDE